MTKLAYKRSLILLEFPEDINEMKQGLTRFYIIKAEMIKNAVKGLNGTFLVGKLWSNGSKLTFPAITRFVPIIQISAQLPSENTFKFHIILIRSFCSQLPQCN